jgi:hypothetical protein
MKVRRFQKEEAERRAARRDYFLCLFLFFIKKSFPSDSSPVNRCKWGCDEKRGKEGEKTNQQTLHARLCLYVIERYLNNINLNNMNNDSELLSVDKSRKGERGWGQGQFE